MEVVTLAKIDQNTNFMYTYICTNIKIATTMT